MKTKKESLTCQSKKSLSRETPEVRIRMSSGGDADVYKFREMFSSVMSLLYRQGQSGTGKRGEGTRGTDFGSEAESTVRLIAVAISSCDVYGQQRFKIPLPSARGHSVVCNVRKRSFGHTSCCVRSGLLLRRTRLGRRVARGLSVR